MKHLTTTSGNLKNVMLMALGLALLASTLLVTRSAAHGTEILIKSDPADGSVLEQSPSQVMAWFDSELETDSTLQVFDLEGNQVDNRDGGVDLYDPDHASMVVSVPLLPDGVFIVQWKAVLADGDTVESVFTFGVGESGEAVGQVQPDQIAVVQNPSPAGDNEGFPLGLLAASIGTLVLVIVGGVLYFRRGQSR